MELTERKNALTLGSAVVSINPNSRAPGKNMNKLVDYRSIINLTVVGHSFYIQCHWLHVK